MVFQLTEDGAITEPGQNAQMIAEEEHKPELKLVQTQLQLMVVLIVLGRRLKVRVVTYRSAQVKLYGRMKRLNIFFHSVDKTFENRLK